MTEAQRNELFTAWVLYQLYQAIEQRLMIDEYLLVSEENCSRDRFLSFLKARLQIEGYWEKIGLA